MDPNRPFREGEAELARLRAIFQTLQFLWSVRGPLLNEAMARARAFVGQGVPIRTAALLAGRQLNLPPRRVAPSRPGMSTQQVRQYHRRQQQRGRRPGQDPRRRQRETEELF